MCVSLILAGIAVAASAVGTVSSIASANGAKAAAQYQRDIENKQYQEAKDTARIQALDQENAKTEAFNRARSAALAAIGASGLGEQISFFQGIDVNSQQAFLRDVRAVRLNLVQQESTLSDKIAVSDYGYQIASFNSGMAKLGAVADFVKTAASAASFYGQNASGGSGSSSGGGAAYSNRSGN